MPIAGQNRRSHDAAIRIGAAASRGDFIIGSPEIQEAFRLIWGNSNSGPTVPMTSDWKTAAGSSDPGWIVPIFDGDDASTRAWNITGYMLDADGM